MNKYLIKLLKLELEIEKKFGKKVNELSPSLDHKITEACNSQRKSDMEDCFRDLESMLAQKSGIKFGSPDVPEKKALEALGEALNSKQHKEGETYEFTYVTMNQIRNQIQPGVLLNWGCKKIGFGQICLYSEDGKIKIDDEYMGKEFVKAAFNYLIDQNYEK